MENIRWLKKSKYNEIMDLNQLDIGDKNKLYGYKRFRRNKESYFRTNRIR